MATHQIQHMIKLTGVTINGGTLSWTGTTDYDTTSNVVDTNDDNDLDQNVDYWNITSFLFSGYYIESGAQKWAVYTSSSYPTNAYIPFQTVNSPVTAGAITLDTSGSTTLYTTELVDEIVVCFLKGTTIETLRGSIAVEHLKRGDVLAGNAPGTPGGTIKFIHRMSVDKHTDFSNVLSLYPKPVLLKAGSLAENSPNKDLFVSRDHALFLNNEILVEASALVNGESIVFHDTKEPIDYYYHIELEDHSLVWAHNTLSESYIDNVSRALFDTYEEFMSLYPEMHDMKELDYPRAKSWRQIPRHIKALLEERKNTLFPKAVKNVA
ncbi:Hint domain-containing protein [Desulfovibrio inopinatus]|uniref:Hint domain-containing protein n=1 Tax=Desulfovibrio inopinatus TaxID=102109 RepID=UPI0003F832F5|nr:Hint domain-containing protein [Desulfovibrio inopinatus]